MKTNNNFTTRSANENEHSQFFSAENRPACIGHLRGDFGQGDDGFWSSWWDVNENLKTQNFKQEFDVLVKTLRKGPLKDYRNLESYCREHITQKISGGYTDMYGFIMESDNYRYAVRLTPVKNDYQVYIYCYDLSLLEPDKDDIIPLLAELREKVEADVEAYRKEMLAKSNREIYDNAYYIHIIENVEHFFLNVDWVELEQSSDTDLFIGFISTKKPFLKSFLAWVDEQDGVDASSTKAAEDTIFDFLINESAERDGADGQ